MKTKIKLRTKCNFFVVLLILTLFSCVKNGSSCSNNNCNKPIFLTKTYDNDQLEDYLKSIGGDTVYYFDLDNTLFTTNNYNYGSDGWSVLIGDSIDALYGKDSDSATTVKMFLYNGVQAMIFNCLKSDPTSVVMKNEINSKVSACVEIKGLTSRGSAISSISQQNLSQAGYYDFEVISTTGKNKGVAIYNDYQKLKRKHIVYIDDTESKIVGARDSLVKLFADNKSISINFIHFDNKFKKKYSEELASAYWSEFKSTYDSFNKISDLK